ncbi:hypothetical protein DFJ74DRAFT_679682 [Hyaloraphidium curvatum]|nr:hypothetical protein DFJ74DRAFT_679682 [Hyaloraphidium curvatum]
MADLFTLITVGQDVAAGEPTRRKSAAVSTSGASRRSVSPGRVSTRSRRLRHWAILRQAVLTGRARRLLLLADGGAAAETANGDSRPTIQFAHPVAKPTVADAQPLPAAALPGLVPLELFLASGSPPAAPGFKQKVIMYSPDGTLSSTAPYVQTIPASFDMDQEPGDDDDDDLRPKRRAGRASSWSSFSTSSDGSDDDTMTIRSTTTYGDLPRHPKGWFADLFEHCRPNYDTKPFPPWRQKIRVLMNDPSSSRLARAIDTYIFSLIIVSTISFVIISVPVIHDNPSLAPFFFAWECFVSTSFLIEIILRWIGMKYWREFFSLMNLIDVLATFPFFIELIVAACLGHNLVTSSMGLAGLQVLRILRIFRVFRLFKVVRKSGKMKLLGLAMKESLDGIAAFCMIFFLALLFTSTLVYYAETSQAEYSGGQWIYTSGYAPGAVSQFSSIPGSFWFGVVSLTTTGYGDVYPQTIAGRIVTMFLLVGALFVLAFPLTMITLSYATVARREQAQKLTRRLRKHQARLARQKAKEDEAMRRAMEKESGEKPPSSIRGAMRRASIFDIVMAVKGSEATKSASFAVDEEKVQDDSVSAPAPQGILANAAPAGETAVPPALPEASAPTPPPEPMPPMRINLPEVMKAQSQSFSSEPTVVFGSLGKTWDSNTGIASQDSAVDGAFYSLPQLPVEKALKRTTKGTDGRLPGNVHLKVFEFERTHRESNLHQEDDDSVDEEVGPDLLSIRVAVRNREHFSKLMTILAEAQVL